jgi:hypothetical protein
MTQLDLIFRILSGFSLSVCIKIMTELDLIFCILSGFSLSVCNQTMTQLHLIFRILSGFSLSVCIKKSGEKTKDQMELCHGFDTDTEGKS